MGQYYAKKSEATDKCDNLFYFLLNTSTCFVWSWFPLKYLVKFSWIWRNYYYFFILILILLHKSATTVLFHWNHVWAPYLSWPFLVKLFFSLFFFYLSGISRRSTIFIWFFFLNFYSWCAFLATLCLWSSLSG